MRADRDYPHQEYDDFWEWLRWHPFWILSLIFGYVYYLSSTDEVQ